MDQRPKCEIIFARALSTSEQMDEICVVLNLSLVRFAEIADDIDRVIRQCVF